MHRLTGHAIVSDDDRIADAAGRFPEALRNDADWTLFQRELDKAALVLIGRASHEAAPNIRRRRRLIVSRGARGLERRDGDWWLNPTEMAVADALARLLPCGGEVAVPGGQAVFDLIGAAGFDAFHLARRRGVRLAGGRGLFAACERGVAASAILVAGGLVAGPQETIDPEAGVTLTIWRRPAGDAG